jgi:hypothetical protein
MKTMLIHPRRNRQQQGYALLLVLIFIGLSVLLLSSAMSWTSQSTRLTDRNNEYFTTAAAAEAATEKVLVRLTRDYIHFGEGTIYNNLSSYRSLVPTAIEDSYWSKYTFTDPSSGAQGTYVARLSPVKYAVLDGQYKGLNGYQSLYRITSNARSIGSGNKGITAGVRQDVSVQSIPLFQFAIFYNMDMEINPSPPMVVTGRVHSNGDIYSVPSSSLTFSNDVTSSGSIYPKNMPGDPQGNRGISNPNIIYKGEHDGGTSTLNLPIGTSNTPDSVYEVLQVPPSNENPLSAMGTNRFFNKADVIILISNTTVTVTSGVMVDNKATTVQPAQWTNFISSTNAGFYDARESLDIKPVEVDVKKLTAWIQSGSNPITPKLSGKPKPNIVYVANFQSPFKDVVTGTKGNLKTNSVAALPGIRLINGDQLPPNGLTIATPNPLYVKGDYNITDGVQSSKLVNDTAHTFPSALVGDAITILSSSWNDLNSSKSLDNRKATDTTVNAAFLSGIVPTGNGYYSGGVENFPRFLEDWSGKTIWYNGSMVVMFNSKKADSPWNSTGVIYNAPTRKWAFDKNFLDIAKLPPGTPQILFVERMDWVLQAANTP